MIKEYKKRLLVCWKILHGHSVMWRMHVTVSDQGLEIRSMNRTLVAENVISGPRGEPTKMMKQPNGVIV